MHNKISTFELFHQLAVVGTAQLSAFEENFFLQPQLNQKPFLMFRY